MEQFEKVFHLSHTDLDGYSCQLISRHSFGKRVEFFNANYGEEINIRLQQIVRELLKLNSALVVVTDLALSYNEALFLNSAIKKLHSMGKSIELLLFDHHSSSFELSLKYDWYSVDEGRSATKIVYDTFLELGWLKNEPEWMGWLVSVVDASDRWLEQKSEFNMGRVWSYMVNNLTEINRVSFEFESREYILAMIEHLATHSQGYSAVAVDELTHRYKKLYFKKGIDNILENLVADFIVELISDHMEKMSFYYKNLKGILTYELEFAPAVGNRFLNTFEDFDFFVNIKSSGEFFICSIDEIDVSKIAKAWAIGGGHKNSAGGKIEALGDIFDYTKAKEKFLNTVLLST